MLRKLRASSAGGDVGSRARQAGFTMVELMVVVALSVIIMAGMAGLIEMASKAFSQSRNLESVTDSARRTLSNISRQVKTALHIDDANTDATQFTFWGDIDNDNPAADVDNYQAAEKVRFYMSGGKLLETITQPAGSTDSDTTMSLASNVTGVQFLYFLAGVKPAGDMVNGYSNAVTTGENATVGMVKVILQYKRNEIRKTFEQDMFLRILIRSTV